MSPVFYHDGKFPPKQLDYSRLISLIGPANAALARYDGVLSAIPNASVLLSPLTTQEAVLSSRIEGTQATMGEVLEFEAKGDNKQVTREKQDDIQEVLNYRKAMRHAMSLLEGLPICERLILQTHEVLMDSVRGHGKTPGKYRLIQNWIGPPDSTIEQARFVPISPEALPEGMRSFERYVNSEQPDRLIQLAIIHAEFESLHPFLDGNGRLGRMLVPLFLFNADLIHSPMFYISAYFEQNRDAYYERLLAVSRDDDWDGWCEFFLKAIKIQAEDNLKKASGILKLYNDMKQQFADLTHSQYSIHALDWIFDKPIFRRSDFVKNSSIPEPTAKRILSVLKDKGVLKEIRSGRGSRSAILAYTDLLNLAEGKDVF